MSFFEKQLNSQTVFKGRIFSVEVDEVGLDNGEKSVRECVRHSGGAAVLLIKDGKILLVKQFRYLYGKEIYEIPAGKLNGGEEPMAAAERELEEETGYRAQLVRLAEIYPTPGYTDEIIHIYFAESFTFVGSNPDEGEFLNCEFVPVSEVLKMLESGEICDAKTAVAVYKYLYEKQALQM